MIGKTSNSSQRGRSWSLGADFDRFLAAAAVSNLGDGIRTAALPLLALSLTSDPRLVALVSAAAMLPWLALGPLGGVIVDRVDRRRLMIGGQLVRAAAGVTLVALIATEATTILGVVVIAFVIGAGEIVVDGSSQAAIPLLVDDPDDLDRANGRLISAITLLDGVVGVALGAVLFSVGAGLPFIVDAVTFVVAAVILVAVRRDFQGERIGSTSVRSDIGAGLRFLRQHRLLRGMVGAVALSNFAGNAAFAVLVVLVVDELGASEGAFGLVLGVGALGGVAASVVAARLVDRFGRRRMIGLTPLVTGAGYVAVAAASNLWVIVAAWGVISFAIVCFNVPGQTIRQMATPDHLLGRVVTTFRMFGLGAAPLGAIAGGFVAESAGVRAANLVAAVGTLLSGLVLHRALRHLDPEMEPRPGAIDAADG